MDGGCDEDLKTRQKLIKAESRGATDKKSTGSVQQRVDKTVKFAGQSSKNKNTEKTI